MPPSSNMKAL
ncbi:unnamed protein product, partial [Cuscuta epithymum]